MSLFAVDLLACEFAPKKFLRRSRSNYLTAKENLALRRGPPRCKSCRRPLCVQGAPARLAPQRRSYSAGVVLKCAVRPSGGAEAIFHPACRRLAIRCPRRRAAPYCAERTKPNVAPNEDWQGRLDRRQPRVDLPRDEFDLRPKIWQGRAVPSRRRALSAPVEGTGHGPLSGSHRMARISAMRLQTGSGVERDELLPDCIGIGTGDAIFDRRIDRRPQSRVLKSQGAERRTAYRNMEIVQ